jgi:hypothetical protein
MYVSIVNENFRSGSPFHCQGATMSDFYQTILYSPIFFFISAVVQLRAPFDLKDVPCTSIDIICHIKPFSFWNCYSWNLFLWYTAYLLGLHFTYLDKGILDDFSLSEKSIKKWTAFHWLSLAGILIFAILSLAYVVRLYI